MRDYHKIAVIPGDLNGGTVTDSASEISYAAEGLLNKSIIHTTHNFNADYFQKHEITELGEDELTGQACLSVTEEAKK